MNTKNGNKRPKPSYEEGKLRDPSVEKKMQGLTRGQFAHLLKRATRRAAKDAGPRK